MLSQWCALTVMCWCGDIILAISISPDSRPDFGDAPDQTQANPINQDQAQSNPIGPNWEPDFGNAPNFGDDLLRSKNWHFPKNAENARFWFFVECPYAGVLVSVPFGCCWPW
jgi:hypothetical protein